MRKLGGVIVLVTGATVTGLGIAVGLFVLLAPSQVRCQLPPLQPGIGVTGGAENCNYVSVLEGGEPIWPLPLLPVVFWSLAPALSLFGTLQMVRGGRGWPFLIIALVVEATSVISFVAGPMFVLYVFLPLLVSTALTGLFSISQRPRGGLSANRPRQPPIGAFRAR